MQGFVIRRLATVALAFATCAVPVAAQTLTGMMRRLRLGAAMLASSQRSANR